MKLVKTIILYGFVALSITGCAASSFMLERGESSYKQQDYRQAFLRLKPVAEAGNKDAQYAVAYMYYYGQGVVENRELAQKWMQRSAEQGNVDAIKAMSILNK